MLGPPATCVNSEGTCLPVTALRCVELNGGLLVLAGEGPNVHVYNRHGRRILSTRVFESQPIHGIQVATDPNPQQRMRCIDFVLWGGPLMKSGRLTAAADGNDIGDARLDFSVLGEFKSPDWILDVALLSSSIFLLTAHNVLLEVSVLGESRPDLQYHVLVAVVKGPGSFLYSGALCLVRSDLIVVASGTVFGEILVWTCFKGSKDSQWSTSIRHNFQGHRGSVFGVAISEPFDIDGRNGRLLASCSDDRTIRLWDISDCDDPSHVTSSGSSLTETGFGGATQVGEPELTWTWAHQSRVWGVEFVSRRATSAGHQILLASRGEDAAFQLWSYEPSQKLVADAATANSLKPIYHDQHHNGKNVWSMAQLGLGEYLMICTGGADGQILLRRLETARIGAISSPTVSKPFTEFAGSSRTLKSYLALNQNECLATTDFGEVYRLRTGTGLLDFDQVYKSPGRGSLVVCQAEEHGVTFVAQKSEGLSAFLADWSTPISIPISVNIGISWMKVASESDCGSSSSTICLVAALADKRAIALWLTKDDLAFHVRETTLLLPSTFAITTCCYDYVEEVLYLGSRAGALAVYTQIAPTLETSGEPICLRHVHGTDSITSITILNRQTRTQGDPRKIKTRHILTTGRDGTYGIHRVAMAKSSLKNELQLCTVHLSSPPFGRNVEGAYFTPSRSSPLTSPPDLMLYGFHATSFVVWNETKQSMFLSIDCGGAHRSWSYKVPAVSTNKILDSGKTAVGESTLVWTKTGTFNWYNSQGPIHTVIQKGGHGREIKAVARCPNRVNEKTLIATGAEDTTIQLFVLGHSDHLSGNPEDLGANHHKASTSFQRIATLNRHTTGLQHLLFSSSGEFLFSSAGCEEFYAWKVTPSVPGISIGTVLWDVMPTTQEDSDARIMSFDLIQTPFTVRANGPPKTDISGNGPPGDDLLGESYILALAYSTGKTKIVRYSPSSARDQGTYETLREIQYGSFCVLQAFFLPSTPFDMKSADARLDVLSAGTNGFLNLNSAAVVLSPDLPRGDKPSSLAMQVHRTHQSSILAMDVRRLGAGTYLVATGGDDNGLGLTLVTPASALISKSSSASSSKMTASSLSPKQPTSLDNPDESWLATTLAKQLHLSNHSTHRFRTIFIPQAHAAAVTALKIIQVAQTPTRRSLAVITAGNDQRVKVWSVQLEVDNDTDTDDLVITASKAPTASSTFCDDNSNNRTTNNMNEESVCDDPISQVMQVQRAASSWTAVADVSGLEVIDNDEEKYSITTAVTTATISRTGRSSEEIGDSCPLPEPAGGFSESRSSAGPASSLPGTDHSEVRPGYCANDNHKHKHRHLCKVLIVGVGMELLSIECNYK